MSLRPNTQSNLPHNPMCSVGRRYCHTECSGIASPSTVLSVTYQTTWHFAEDCCVNLEFHTIRLMSDKLSDQKWRLMLHIKFHCAVWDLHTGTSGSLVSQNTDFPSAWFLAFSATAIRFPERLYQSAHDKHHQNYKLQLCVNIIAGNSASFLNTRSSPGVNFTKPSNYIQLPY